MEIRLTNIINNTKLLNIVIILITIFIAVGIFQAQVKSMKLLKENKDEQIRRNEILNEICQLEKKINFYKDSWGRGKKDAPLVLNTISNIANEVGIKIIAVKPNKEEDYPYYVKSSFNLSLKSESYHALGRFISKLENYSDAIYFIDLFTISLLDEYKMALAGQTEDEGQEEGKQRYALSADLVLGTIALKE